MPPLKTRLRNTSPEGYVEEQRPESPPQVLPGGARGANPFIRCPLPPFNVSPDTLRQFEENGKVPSRRVIPLPISVAGGGNAVITNNTVVNTTGGGSSGSATVPVTALTVTLDVSELDPGAAATAALTVSAVAVLLILGSSDQCEVRIYGDAATQAMDASRSTDSAPPFEVLPGLVTDVVFDTAPYQWNWQNRVFVNQDAPVTTSLYITVINNTSGTVTPSVTLTYLPLE